MLNGVFYLVKENETLINDFIATFGEHEAFMKMLLEFKRMFFRLAESILLRIRSYLQTHVRDKLDNLSASQFDLDQLVKRDLSDIYKPLENTHIYFRIKIVKLLFVIILEHFSFKVQQENTEFQLNGNFSDTVDKMKDFFQLKFENQTFDNYIRFLDYYLQFIRSRNRNTCEVAVAMMKTILSEPISNECIEAIIKSKNYSQLKFSERYIINHFSQTMDMQKTGETLILKKQNARKELGSKLLLGTNCFKFLRILKTKLITKKVNEIRPVEEDTKIQVVSVKQIISQQKLDTFKKSVQIAFFDNTLFENLDDEGVLIFIKASLLKTPAVAFVITYESEKLIIYDQNKKRVKILHPGKFIKIEKVVLSGFKVILLTYRKFERIAIIVEKPEKQEKYFNKLSKIIEIFKDQSFNHKKLDY